MKVFDTLKRFISKYKDRDETGYRELQTECIQADQEYNLFPEVNIAFIFCTKEDLFHDELSSLISTELSVPEDYVKESINTVAAEMINEIHCCVEYPYVETYYRDTYYTFYSQKHSTYSRNCFRISFFSEDVNAKTYHETEELSEKFYGYIVLRPTPNRVIGYSFLSPKIYGNKQFSCCMYQKRVSIFGQKLVVEGFPFSGQDGDALSCAEVSLIMMLDYFSHKYHKYSQLLPSRIVSILSEQKSNQRLLPSPGLRLDLISFVLCKLGFGIRTYARKTKYTWSDLDGDVDVYENEEFKRILYMYIESGFPLIACTEDHSFLLIGRENNLGEDNVQLVAMDDNERPYKMIEYNKQITAFIVPLHEKICMYAEVIKIDEVIKHLESKSAFGDLGIKKEKKDLSHCFLTTSRSYKEYVVKQWVNAKNQSPNKPYMHFVSMTMPHFIWVYELIKAHDIAEKIVDSVFLFDATGGQRSMDHFIMARRPDWIIVRSIDKNDRRKVYEKIQGDTGIFTMFAGNLR